MGGFRFAFEFGWRTYFKFTFEVGKLEKPRTRLPVQLQRPTPSDKLRDADNSQDTTLCAESDTKSHTPPKTLPSATTDDALEQYVKLYPEIFASLGGTQTARKSVKQPVLDTSNAVKSSILFRLPLEIRRMIYRHLLISTNVIEEPACLFDDMQSLFLNERAKLPSIDGAITRTCRLIKQESNPLLYGENVFTFKDAEKLRQFDQYHMPERSPGSRQRDHIYRNRVAMLRSVVIVFRMEHIFLPVRHNNDRKYGREAAWDNWKREIFVERGSYRKPVKFLSLEDLTLDFSAWQLAPDEGLAAQPLISKFRETATGLKKITVRGLQHAESLRKLQDGLGGEGRIFEIQT